MVKYQAMTLVLIVFSLQTIHSSSDHGGKTVVGNIHKRLKSNKAVLRSNMINEFSDKNSGPPLDMNNKLKKVKTHEKRPGRQPATVKIRKGRLVNRSQHLLKVKDLNITSSIDSGEPGTMMELSAVGKNLVTIKGVDDDRYICMSRENGQMFARKSANKDCIFREYLEENFHSTFRLSDDRSPWFIAIDSKGNFMHKVTRKLDFSTFFQLIS